MTLGVTVGKFFPFHRGHEHLIREARRRVDELVVLVGHRPGDSIPGGVRAGWIRDRHPDVTVIETEDDLPEAPEPWAERALALLGGRKPDLAFTSEDYGPAWAAAMGACHESVDPARESFPISGSELRADLSAHWDMLTPPARAHLARRVAVVGAESTGTSTLAEALGRHYATSWTPEYGRWYWEGRRHTPGNERWDTDEFVRIARAQQFLEDDLARLANRVLVCDTDALATHVWHRRFMGGYSSRVEAIADRRSYDLYLLTEPDFPFVQDGTREGEKIRHEMHGWFLDVLRAMGRPFVTVGGSPESRLAEAVERIEERLVFPVLELG